MIKDIEVKEWSYYVYFTNEEHVNRLVLCMDSRDEARALVHYISTTYYLKAWYTTKRTVEVIE